MNSSNIAELLFRYEADFPERTAIIHRGQSITYGELADRVRIRAGLLRRKGIKPGDRLLVFVPMTIGLYEILLAIFHLGATAVFLDAWSNRQRLELALEIADCRGLIGIPRAFLLLLRSANLRRMPVKLLHSFPHWPQDKTPDAMPPYPAAPDDAALITFTTGSTGRPKAALRSHGFLMEQHRVLQEELQIQPGDVDLATLPIFVLNNLACGATTLIPDFDPRRPADIDAPQIIAEAERYGVCSTAGSPAFYEKLSAASNGHSIPTLRRLFTGGAAVFPDLARQLQRAFPQVDIRVLYGSTEAEPISNLSAAELAQAENLAQTGIPVGDISPYIELAIIPIQKGPLPAFSDAEWQDFRLPPGAAGEICVSGNHVLKSYFNSPDAMKENKIRVGNRIFHRTGDAGRIDAAGRLFLLGRAGTLFTLPDGKTCYPMICEYLLKQLPGVHAGTVLQVQDRIIAALERTPDRQEANPDLSGLGLAGAEIHWFDHLPRDPRHQSKFDYGVLLEQLRNQ